MLWGAAFSGRGVGASVSASLHRRDVDCQWAGSRFYCLRPGGVGRVSPRRASHFLVATRKSPKKRPRCTAGFAGPLSAPAPGGSCRKLALRAQTATRQFPPVACSVRRHRRGGALGLGFAIARAQKPYPASNKTAGCRHSPPKPSGRAGFNRPSVPVGRGFSQVRWPGLAPAGDILSCSDKKGRKETPPLYRRLRRCPLCARARRVGSQTRPSGSNRRHDNSRRSRSPFGGTEGGRHAGSASPSPVRKSVTL